MSSTRKFLALALAAFQTKQYEEAGVLFAQAAMSDDAASIAEELGSFGDPEDDQKTDATSCGEDQESEIDNGISGDKDSSDEDSLSWGDADAPGDEDSEVESISSATRRKTTSLFHIGKILSASMSLSEEETDEDGEDDSECEDDEMDADFDGEVLVPASFSSVTVKTEN